MTKLQNLYRAAIAADNTLADECDWLTIGADGRWMEVTPIPTSGVVLNLWVRLHPNRAIDKPLKKLERDVLAALERIARKEASK